MRAAPPIRTFLLGRPLRRAIGLDSRDPRKHSSLRSLVRLWLLDFRESLRTPAVALCNVLA